MTDAQDEGAVEGGAARRTCTLDILLAARSRCAVIYRRGPSKQTCLIRWDRATDTFEVGQWFNGRVYPERSALAPDGEHLLTFMGSFRPPFRTWTALSRPPYFTALALWPKGDTWGGGGAFLSERTFALAHGSSPAPLAPGFALPEGFTLLPPGPATDERFARATSRLPHEWRMVDGSGTPSAPWASTCDGPSGLALRAWWEADDPHRPWRGERRIELIQGDRRAALPGVGWAGFDVTGDLLLARGGTLLRCMADDLAASRGGSDVVVRSHLLADFTDLRFRPLAAPYASSVTDAPGTGCFVPALDRVTKSDRQARQRARRLLAPRANSRDG
ncbi:hypothetical protein [Methylobacterium sp. 17Sr1-1]|uniref:hypothetical protein n=1 Tax=Methylobacterium sp. 17Sr1-1 TaxID=2202826 RepID=UPI000D6EDEA0|nr:hypothetical protein [Methylobacterium sp. 17Sr1-1]AWN54667.1 hypothetical protein DK412_26160 [Methylobacterium sp. 17Sr1-1]